MCKQLEKCLRDIHSMTHFPQLKISLFAAQHTHTRYVLRSVPLQNSRSKTMSHFMNLNLLLLLLLSATSCLTVYSRTVLRKACRAKTKSNKILFDQASRFDNNYLITFFCCFLVYLF